MATTRFAPPRAAYVHVPFCLHHCGYCNFTVVAKRDDLIDDYLSALEIELSWMGEPRSVSTIFLGGGTPTHLPPKQLERLLTLVRNRFPWDGTDGEFSVEANPADLTDEKLTVLSHLGVNRLSLGVQSFRAEKLQQLERNHTAEQARAVVTTAADHFSSVSLDLIFATPKETLEQWQAELHTAVELPIQHISTYALTYEPGTQFWNRREHGELASLSNETEAAMYETAIDELAKAGLGQYEVSNFARPGYECRHNMVYWRAEPYYAVGPGAARYVDGVRSTNHRSTTTYLKRVLSGESPIAETEEMNEVQAAHERIVLGLRMNRGIHLDEFQTVTGFSLMELVGRQIEKYVAQGLMEMTNGHLQLTRAGLLISDTFWPELLWPDPSC